MVWALLGASIESVKIPASVTSIGEGVFRNCSLLSSITYTGTLEEWENVAKGSLWSDGIPATVVRCSDGDANL